jgi:hypothetical protein
VTVLSLQDFSRVIGFAGAVRSRSACAHFALSQIEDAGAMPLLGGFEQSAATGLFHIITMGGNSQDVERFCTHIS